MQRQELSGGSHMNAPELGDLEFQKISRLVFDLSGINLHEGKKELVKARLGKRLREGNFRSFSEYFRYVTTGDGMDELVTMIDAISTNLTFFFREEGHFEKLRSVAPVLLEQAGRRASPVLRIWSAGCSTGEEPYSLAITMREMDAGKNGNAPAARIHATDISTKVLKSAMTGVYPKAKLTNVSPALLKKYFQVGSGPWEGHYRVKKEIREMVTFTRFNLMETPPPDFLFDIIFCRNVMIYFDRTTQEALVKRFSRCLTQGGYLFIGHSESLMSFEHDFTYIEPSVYRKSTHG